MAGRAHEGVLTVGSDCEDRAPRGGAVGWNERSTKPGRDEGAAGGRGAEADERARGRGESDSAAKVAGAVVCEGDGFAHADRS